MEGTASKSEFAHILGVSKAYVSQLVTSQRIVLTEDGKRVRVQESLELLNVTSDPSKAGVCERWAAFRGERVDEVGQAELQGITPASAVEGAVHTSAPPPGPAAKVDAGATKDERAGTGYQAARAQREQAEATMAQIELQKMLGTVAEVEPMLRAVADISAAARTEVLGLPDRLAPLVAPETDPRKVYDLVLHECELICGRVQARMKDLVATLQPAQP